MVESKDAGSFLGGILNNPGTVAILAIIAGLIIFRKPIQEAFSGFGGSLANLFSPAGAIQQAGSEAGQFVFNIGQDVGGAVFDVGEAFGQSVFEAGAGAGEFVFEAGKATGDVVGQFLKDAQQQLDNFFKVQGSNLEIFQSNAFKDIQDALNQLGDTGQKAAEEGGPLSGLFDFFSGLGGGQPEFQGPAIDPETGFFTGIPFTGSISDLPPPLIPFSLQDFAKQFDLTQAEAFGVQKKFGGLDFEAIAAIPTFGEVLAGSPELTASQIANLKLIQAGGGGEFDFGTNTGMALETALLSFGQGDVNLELLKEAQALAAMESLGGFVGGGLFGNPDFPITLGESFLGESGTVVSPSITNLTSEQLKDFIAQFG